MARPKGSKNKTTLEREARVKLEREAYDAQHTLKAGTGNNRPAKKLGIDVLREVMNTSLAMAAAFQPLPPGSAAPRGHRGENIDQFEKWMRLTSDTAYKVADFESPKISRVMMAVTQVTPAAPASRPGDDAKIVNITDKHAINGAYLRLVKGSAEDAA